MDHRDVDERMLVGDATGTEEEMGKEGREKRKARRGRKRKREVSLPWREARVIQLVIDLRNISRFTSTESCSFLGLLLLHLQSALPISSTGCRSFLEGNCRLFNEFGIFARL